MDLCDPCQSDVGLARFNTMCKMLTFCSFLIPWEKKSQRNTLYALWKFTCTPGQLTNTRRSDGAPKPAGALRVVARKKILRYRQLYSD